MKIFHLLTICALVALASTPSTVYAQKGEPVKTWYGLKAGQKSFTVQAFTVQTKWLKASAKELETFIIYDSKELKVDYPIEITALGSGSEPMPYGGSTTTIHIENDVVVTSTTTVDDDGTVKTKTTTTDLESGASTTTTTTTDSDGNTSTTVETKKPDSK